jgi:hypothetical protein
MENVYPANIPLPDDGFIPPRDIKLPPFWQSHPAAWLVFVESRFWLHNFVDETAKFDHVLSAFPEEMVGQIQDLVEAAPAATPYTFLRTRLLETHSLSDYEKRDMLQKTEQMSGCKPSKLLADMMEFCVAGLEQSLPFHYLFTQRLPQALRTQLGEVEPGDPGGRWRSERTSCGQCMLRPRLSLPQFQLQRRQRPAAAPAPPSEEAAKVTAVVAAISAAESPRVPRLRPLAVPPPLPPQPPRRTLLLLLSPGSPVVSAFSTGILPTELPSAHRPAAGETSQPRAA